MMQQFWLVICSHVSGLPFHVFASRRNIEWLTYVTELCAYQSCSDVDTMMKLPHTLPLITYPPSCAALDCPPQWRVDLNRRVSGDTRTTAIPFYKLGMASIVGLWVSKVQGEREKQVMWWRSFFLVSEACSSLQCCLWLQLVCQGFQSMKLYLLMGLELLSLWLSLILRRWKTNNNL